MRTVVNRVLLGLVGLVLLVVGAAALIGGFDLPGRLNWLNLPSWWPWQDPGQPVLSEADRTRWSDEGWWWPAVIGGLSALVLLSLWWFLAQLRRRVLHRVDVPGGEQQEDVQLRGRALSDAIAADASAVPGVERADVRLRGRPNRPRAELALTLGADGDPVEVLEVVHRRILPSARATAGVEDFGADVRFRGPRPAKGRYVG